MKKSKFIEVALICEMKKIAQLYDKSPSTILLEAKKVMEKMTFETLDTYQGKSVDDLRSVLSDAADEVKKQDGRPSTVAFCGTMEDLMNGKLQAVNGSGELPEPLKELLKKAVAASTQPKAPNGCMSSGDFLQMLMGKFGAPPSSDTGHDDESGEETKKGPKKPKGPTTPPKPIDS